MKLGTKRGPRPLPEMVSFPNVRGLSSHQVRLHMATAARPRKTVKFCNACGGTHAGRCTMVSTTHGTRCRPALVEAVERRFRERLGK